MRRRAAHHRRSVGVSTHVAAVALVSSHIGGRTLAKTALPTAVQ